LPLEVLLLSVDVHDLADDQGVRGEVHRRDTPALDVQGACRDKRSGLDLAIKHLEQLRLILLVARDDAAVVRYGHHVHGSDVDGELVGQIMPLRHLF